MEAKQVRDLLEAYSSIYEEKEEPEMEEGEEEEEKGKKKGKKEKEEKGKKEDEKEMKESADLFDYLLEYLVAEGYADTNKAALAIMANMSEEWKQDIVEKHSTFGYSADDPQDDFDQFVKKGPKTNKQKRQAIALNKKILSKKED